MTKNVRNVSSSLGIAMCNAFDNAVAKGRNPGKVGHRILTNRASGLGQQSIGFIENRMRKESQRKAESAA